MTGRTLELVRAESQARVDARPRPTDRVRQLHAHARDAFDAGSPLAQAHPDPDDDEVGYRLHLPRWHAQREPHPTRRRRGKPTTWRPIFDSLSLNARVHRQAHDRAVATVRGWVAMNAGPKQVALPEGDHLHVQLVYRPANPGSRDATNLQGLAKPCVDGLARGPRKTRKDRTTGLQVPVVGLDLVPDDCEPWLTEHRPAILEPLGPERSGLWLDVVVTNPRGVIS